MKTTVLCVETGGLQLVDCPFPLQPGEARKFEKVTVVVNGLTVVRTQQYCQRFGNKKGGKSCTMNLDTVKLFPGVVAGMEVDVSLE